MPAEAQRLRRKIGRRDRVLITVALAGSVVVLGTAAAAAELNKPESKANCVTYDQAGVMGGGTWRLCGASAAALCAERSNRSRRIRAQCNRLAAASKS